MAFSACNACHWLGKLLHAQKPLGREVFGIEGAGPLAVPAVAVLDVPRHPDIDPAALALDHVARPLPIPVKRTEPRHSGGSGTDDPEYMVEAGRNLECYRLVGQREVVWNPRESQSPPAF